MAHRRGVTIVRDNSDPTVAQTPVRRALGRLQEAFSEGGIPCQIVERLAEAFPDGACILVAGRATALAQPGFREAGAAVPDEAEAVGIIPVKVNDRLVLLVCGSDVRGLVYALLEVADRVLHAVDPAQALGGIERAVERPANPIRSVARLFTSDVEDKPWFYDQDFWRRYLATLIAQRFNRFSLTLGLGYNFPRGVRDAYFYFAYPFLISVPGYDVRASGVSDAERDQNLAMLQFISEEAAACGLHFQLGLWTHAYEWIDSPAANHVILGLTPENHAAYCRDALHALLEACPAIGGVTLRIHGESGIPEGSFGFWRTLFDGVVRCGRRVEIDMHAKGIDQQMIDVVLETGRPVNVSPKYWAEHMGLPYHQASIRALERPPRREGKASGFMALSAGSRRFTR